MEPPPPPPLASQGLSSDFPVDFSSSPLEVDSPMLEAFPKNPDRANHCKCDLSLESSTSANGGHYVKGIGDGHEKIALAVEQTKNDGEVKKSSQLRRALKCIAICVLVGAVIGAALGIAASTGGASLFVPMLVYGVYMGFSCGAMSALLMSPSEPDRSSSSSISSPKKPGDEDQDGRVSVSVDKQSRPNPSRQARRGSVFPDKEDVDQVHLNDEGEEIFFMNYDYSNDDGRESLDHDDIYDD